MHVVMSTGTDVERAWSLLLYVVPGAVARSDVSPWKRLVISRLSGLRLGDVSLDPSVPGHKTLRLNIGLLAL